MAEKHKLTIYRPDCTTVEVEPVKPWSPCGHDTGDKCHICDGDKKGAVEGERD